MSAKGVRYYHTFKRFIARCKDRRERETLCRLFKEICIIDQEFSSAMFYRERQLDNFPRFRSAGTKPKRGPHG